MSDCNCYCGGWSSRGGSRRGQFLCASVVRVDSTAVRLIRFLGDQLVQTRSGSLSFGGMWMVLLSWHVARFGPR